MDRRRVDKGAKDYRDGDQSAYRTIWIERDAGKRCVAHVRTGSSKVTGTHRWLLALHPERMATSPAQSSSAKVKSRTRGIYVYR